LSGSGGGLVVVGFAVVGFVVVGFVVVGFVVTFVEASFSSVTFAADSIPSSTVNDEVEALHPVADALISCVPGSIGFLIPNIMLGTVAPSSVTVGWSQPVTVIVTRAMCGVTASICFFSSSSAFTNGAGAPGGRPAR